MNLILTSFSRYLDISLTAQKEKINNGIALNNAMTRPNMAFRKPMTQSFEAVKYNAGHKGKTNERFDKGEKKNRSQSRLETIYKMRYVVVP